MIIIFDIRKLVNILLIAFMSLAILLLSLNYLFASDDTASETVIHGFMASDTDDLRNILQENSILQENLLEVEGVASHYGKKFHKRKTASGERYNMNEYSAAHKKLPFGTILKVTNLSNDKSVLVRINDRGPFVGKRIIDLSKKSASDLDGLGLPNVKIEGFVRGNFDPSAQIDDNFYFAYSLTYEPMVLPSDYLIIRHTFNDFNSAVQYYKELTDSGLLEASSTFIVFNKETFDTFDSDTEEYHIASWRPVLKRKVPVMVAEKVYPNN